MTAFSRHSFFLNDCSLDATRQQLAAKEAEAAAAAEALAAVNAKVANATGRYDAALQRLAADREALASEAAERDAAQAQVGYRLVWT